MVSCCGYGIPKTLKQHMQRRIPYMFDHWPDPVVHLLLLKSSMPTQDTSSVMTNVQTIADTFSRVLTLCHDCAVTANCVQ